MTTFPPASGIASPLVGPHGEPLLRGERAATTSTDDQAQNLALLRRSAQTTIESTVVAPQASNFLVWAMAQRGDGFSPWGAAPKMRDGELRAFWPSENLLASAVATTAARNAALSWKISGDEQTALAAQAMCNNANFGAGWEDFILQTSIDLYTQDSGAFVELMREQDSPLSPVIGFAHLDAARTYPTGNPEFPFFYEDSRGKMHRMPWYSIQQLLEMPSPITPSFGGVLYRMQYSAVTRVLRAAQVLKSISIYKDEKVSGRFQKALHLVTGVSDKQVQDALMQASIYADNAGLQRYMQPAIVGSLDPNAPIKHDTIELASLPDGWNERDTTELYILALAMGFLTDYQEFAPLPGGGLGTATQSQTLHAKARGRGPGLFQKLIARFMNGSGVLPSNVLYEYDEEDIEAESMQAENKGLRATARATRLQSHEIDEVAARQIALDEGDLTQDQFDELTQRDEQRKRDQAAADQQALALAQAQQTANADAGAASPARPARNTTQTGAANTAPVRSDAGTSTGTREFVDPGEDGLYAEVHESLGFREDAAVAEVANPARDGTYSQVTQDRLDYEAEVGMEITGILSQARRRALAHLMGERAASPATITAHHPVPYAIEKTIVRDESTGHITGIIERPLLTEHE